MSDTNYSSKVSVHEVKDICDKALCNRIAEASSLLESAETCRANGDYMQAVVRLEGLFNIGKFTSLEMALLDAASRDAV